MKTININKVSPAGGVIITHNAPRLYDDMYDSDVINLSYERYMEEKPEDIDEEQYSDMYYSDEDTYLIGFKRVCNGHEDNVEYEPDLSKDYCAIINFPYTQIVYSRFLSYCEVCSPCYPMQNDLENKGCNPTYQLPPDLYDEDNEYYKHLEIIEIVE